MRGLKTTLIVLILVLSTAALSTASATPIPPPANRCIGDGGNLGSYEYCVGAHFDEGGAIDCVGWWNKNVHGTTCLGVTV